MPILRSPRTRVRPVAILTRFHGAREGALRRPR
jgi:hypothetical protein